MDDVSPTSWPQVLEEHTFTTGGTPAVTQAYTYGHAPLAQRRWDGTNWQGHHYGHDAHGSVRLLSDGAGQVTDALHYEAFGQVVGRVGSTPASRAYSGEEFDGDLGFYHLRARYHNADSGRFWTADSFEGFTGTAQSHHAYGYVENNPVNYTDPSGHYSMGESMAVASLAPMVRSMVMAVADGQNYYVHGLAGGSALKANGRVEADMIQSLSQVAGIQLGKENFWKTSQGAPFLLLNNPNIAFQGRQCARPECLSFDPDAPIYGPAAREGVFRFDYQATPGYQALLDLAEPFQLARDFAGLYRAQITGNYDRFQEHSQTLQGLARNASVIDTDELQLNLLVGTVKAEAALLTGGVSEGGLALAQGDYEKAQQVFGGVAAGGVWLRNLQLINSDALIEASTVGWANDARRRMQSGKGVLALQRTAANERALQEFGLTSKTLPPKPCYNQARAITSQEAAQLREGAFDIGPSGPRALPARREPAGVLTEGSAAENAGARRPGGYRTGDFDSHGRLSPGANRAPGHTNTRADGFVQSHHGIQREWAKRKVADYDEAAAPANLLRSSSGEVHAKISAAQRARRRQPGGWDTDIRTEFNLSYRELVDAGLSSKDAQRLIRQNYKYFDSLGAFD